MCKNGLRLLLAGLAQQHRRTRQAVYPKPCSSALVFGDCKSMCRVDLHMCKCSDTRLLSAGLAQQHRRTRQAVHPKPCSSALVFGDCKSMCRVDLHMCKCSDTRLPSVVWHSSTEEQGRQFTLNPAALHWCLVTASLCAEWIFIGVNAVAQGCCQLVWHSSTEEQGRQFTLNPAAVHLCLVTATMCRVDLHMCKNAVTQCCRV